MPTPLHTLRRACLLSGAAVMLAALPAQAQSQSRQSPLVTTPLALTYKAAAPLSYNNLVQGVSVSPDGHDLRVRATPFKGYTGGRLFFGGYPYWISVADFAPYGGGQGRALNGDAYRGTGLLPTPTGKWHTMATLVPGSNNVYQVNEVAMSGIRRGWVGGWTGTLSGTITTDGHRGNLRIANIMAYELHVDGVENHAVAAR
jgi:hypothetical protein